jgi:ATP:ADP antiporter, AAA family
VRADNSQREARLDVLAATVASTAMIAQQVAGKATRDALFLTQFDVRRLPGMMIISALLSFVAAMFAARSLNNHGPRRVVRGAFLLGAIAFALEFAASWFSKRSIAIIVYVHMALFGATVISVFWSLINERFDPHAAKKAVARIAAGGTLGGVLGGFIGWNVASLTSVRGMLFVLAVLNLIALAALHRICSPNTANAPAPSKPPAPQALGAGIKTLRVERYLLTLGVMVAIVAATEAFTDYLFAARVKEHIADSRRLMAFFSAFHMGIAILTFLAQAGLSRRALERFGLAGTIAGLPILVLALAAVALQAPGLLTIVILRGGEAVMSNSLWRSAYELLYTPVAQEKKRPMKTLIDVGCDRLGTLVASAAILGMLALLMPPATLLMVVMALCVLGIVAARVLQRGYIAALEESLRVGAVAIEGAQIVDATTRRTLRRSTVRNTPLPVAQSLAPVTPRAEGPILEAVADLLSGDRLRIQRVLCAGADDPRLTSFVIPLLGRSETRAEALAWLHRLGPRICGQLVDALVDGTLHDDVRRRIPRVLRGVPCRVAAEGLLRGLVDPRFDVRYECGIALARMVECDSSITIDARAILAAVHRELAIERKILDAEPLLDPLDDDADADAPIFRAALRDRATRGLEHVFTILSLMLDREPLRTAFRALTGDDDALRGTALEYLENVLPPEIRDALWPYVTGKRRPMRHSRRPAAEILRDLLHREGFMGRPSTA